jgi:hypothetical protein
MALRAADGAEARLLGNALGKNTAENLTLKLYTNNITPGESDVAATYTEATGFGYAAKTLVPGDWTVTPGAPCAALAPPQVWTFTGALGNVYGYFLVGATSALLYWAERFTAAPFNPQNNGDTITVTPRVTLRDEQD